MRERCGLAPSSSYEFGRGRRREPTSTSDWKRPLVKRLCWAADAAAVVADNSAPDAGDTLIGCSPDTARGKGTRALDASGEGFGELLSLRGM